MNDTEIAVALTEATERSKSNTKRIDKLEQEMEAIHSLASSVAVMAESMKGIKSDVASVKADIDQIKSIPADRWKKVIEYIITAVVGVALGCLFAQLGLN